MAYSYDEVIRSQVETWQAEYAAANAEMERCRTIEEPGAMHEAITRMYRAEQNLITLNSKIHGMQRAAQAQYSSGANFEGMKRHQVELARKFGLNADEAAIALASTSDPNVDDHTRMRDYYEGRQRRNEWRAAGNLDEIDMQGRRR
jgi:hypothetical protein